MFGGVGASSSDLGDTWTFSDGCWRLQRPATSPPARENPVFAYDPVRKVTVLYGGFQLPPDQQSGQSISLFSDTWIWNGEFWSQVAAASGPHLYAPQGAFDLAHGVLVVFGHNGLTGLTETWIWDGNRWMRKSPAVSPPDRGEAMMGYDPITQRVVLFGGFSNGGGLLGDTWLWDGTNWTQQHPAVSPPPQQNGAMGSGRTLLLYGDQSDTWLWTGSTWKQVTPAQNPGRRGGAAATGNGRNVWLFGGTVPGGNLAEVDLWQWDGLNWSQV
jgi:hypothetical protein